MVERLKRVPVLVRKSLEVTVEAPAPSRWLNLYFLQVQMFSSHWFSVGDFSIDLNLNNE
jgi:hypothetical protein